MNDCWVAMFIYAVVYIVCMLVFFMECFRNEKRCRVLHRGKPFGSFWKA